MFERADPLGRIPAWRIDVLLAIAMTGLIAIQVTAATEEGSRAPDAVAYIVAGLVGPLLLLRRRWPLPVLVASLVAVMAYHSLNYPAIGAAWPLSVALYTAARAGHTMWALVTSLSAMTVAFVWRTLLEPEPILAVIGFGFPEAIAVVGLVFLGDAVRSRRALAAETGERLKQAALDQEREAERRVIEERMRIARELHDVIAHTVAVIGVQARAASENFDDRPQAARAALDAIRAASREAMAELRATVGVLRRENEAPLAPPPGIDQIDGLVEAASSSGIVVKLEMEGDSRRLPATIELTAYRVVQESLTNVLRHAGASMITVHLRYLTLALEVEVTDDGSAAAVIGEGHGIAGMRERVAAVGGQLEAGAQAGGGFRVWARLPVIAER